MKHLIRPGFIIIFYIFFTTVTYGQINNNRITTNNSDLFNTARNLAFNGKRATARSICFAILKDNNLYYDAGVLIGRTYAWDHQYDSARIAFNEVLANKAGYYDAIDGTIDLEYWDEKYEACIKQCEIGLSFHPNDKNFELKQAKALIALRQDETATSLLNKIITRDTDNHEARKLLDAIREANLKNKITLNYTYDYFEKRMISPWHMTYLQYARKTAYGSIIGRLNYANRFDTGGLQIETDAYPKITKSTYLYLNLGYSNKSIFPAFRSGAELYINLPSAFEASLGFRHLSFTSGNVFIYTGSMAKYVGDYWLSARTFITPNNIGTSVSGMVIARRYFADADNYLGLRISYGTSPDDRKKLLVSTSEIRVKSEAVRIEMNKKFRQVWIVNLGAICENEEYYPSAFRWVYTADITISRLF